MNNIKFIVDRSSLINKSLVEKYDIDVFDKKICFDDYKDKYAVYITSSIITDNEIINEFINNKIKVLNIKNSSLSINLLIEYFMNCTFNNNNPYIIDKNMNMISNRLDTKFFTDSNIDMCKTIGVRKRGTSQFVSGNITCGNVDIYKIYRDLNFTLEHLFGVLSNNVNNFDDRFLYAQCSSQVSNEVHKKLSELKYFKNILYTIDNKLNGKTLCLSMLKK